MSDLHVVFVSKSFLRSHWDLEYRAWQNSETEKAVDDRLALWAKRGDLKETSAESAFIDVFFRETSCYTNWPRWTAKSLRKRDECARLCAL
jgi:hypothetical protein